MLADLIAWFCNILSLAQSIKLSIKEVFKVEDIQLWFLPIQRNLIHVDDWCPKIFDVTPYCINHLSYFFRDALRIKNVGYVN